MARPLRIEYAGAWYHVMNRGLAKQAIFHNEEAFQLFFRLMEEAHKRYQIQIHAYCLMNNHYHLLVHTPLPNLGRAMRHIDGLYTVKSNRLIGRDGPLFRGRYKAILVEVENYLVHLSRYIHLNPFAAGLVKRPEDYPWSSYKYFLHGNNPEWLYCDETLSHFSFNKNHAYEKFIKEGFENEKTILKIDDIPILGSESFIKKIKEEKINPDPIYDIPEHSSLFRRYCKSSNEIIKAVSHYYSVAPSDMIDGKKEKKIYRNIAIYLCYLLTGNSYSTLAKEFQLTVSALSRIFQMIEIEIKVNLDLKRDIELVKNKISKMET